MNEPWTDELEKYLQLTLKEGRKLAKKIKPKDLCAPKCVSCLVALARHNVKEDIGNLRGDVCMLEARDILAKELNWIIK